MRRERGAMAVALVLIASGCATLRPGESFARPAVLAGEWVDLSHTTPGDTALWVLRSDGYDGSAHLRAEGGQLERTQTRYGVWYFQGDLADSARRAICFARRVGRDGATCLRFVVDTVEGRRRLVVEGYRGERRVGDRELVERR